MISRVSTSLAFWLFCVLRFAFCEPCFGDCGERITLLLLVLVLYYPRLGPPPYTQDHDIHLQSRRMLSNSGAVGRRGVDC